MAGRAFPAPYKTYAELAELLTAEVGWFVDEDNLRHYFSRYTKMQSLRADVLRRLAQIQWADPLNLPKSTPKIKDFSGTPEKGDFG